MKPSKKVIIITDPRAALREFAQAYRKAQKGELEEKDTIGVSGLRELQSILSPERLKLLKTIRKHSPGSIKELARLVGRDAKNVHRDLTLLKAAGLIELREKGKKVQFIPACQKIVIEL